MPVLNNDLPWEETTGEPPGIPFLALVFMVERPGGRIRRCFAFDNTEAAVDWGNALRLSPPRPLVEMWVWDVSSGTYTLEAERQLYSSFDGQAWHRTAKALMEAL